MFPRLYAILDIDIARGRGLAPAVVFDQWIDAGVRLVQLRAKTLAGGEFLTLAQDLSERASRAGVTFIVNDRVDVAKLCGAAGAHAGQGDLAPADVRRILPRPAIVGYSTHNDEQMRAALAEPIDYVATGPVFETRSKLRHDPVIGFEGVRRASVIAGTFPLVAIGGITLDTAPAVIEAGASIVAVISALMDADPAQRARAFLSALA